MNLNEIATKADVQEVLSAVEQLKRSLNNSVHETPFLRSADVRKMLNISASTLQRMRISGLLNGKKVNGTWFYKSTDIQNILEEKQ